MGFEVGTVSLGHHPRKEGQSSYTWRKLASLAIDTILSHSDVPLRFAVGLGIVISAVSTLAGLVIAINALFFSAAIPGWASLIVSVALIGGVQIFLIGVIGIYVGKAFNETKKRPLYLVRKASNFDDVNGLGD
jgi:dolichol-phosphate mannosyltransferase